DQKPEADGKMRHDQWRKQHGLQRSLEAELVALEGEGKGGAHHQRNGGRPSRHNEPVAESGLKVVVRKGLDKPKPQPPLWWERQNRPAVEGRKRDDKCRQE